MADRLPNVLANDVRERRMRELPSHILCLSGCSPLRRGESSSCVMPCAHGWTCCDGSCKHSSVARSVDGPLALRQAQKSIRTSRVAPGALTHRVAYIRCARICLRFYCCVHCSGQPLTTLRGFSFLLSRLGHGAALAYGCAKSRPQISRKVTCRCSF